MNIKTYKFRYLSALISIVIFSIFAINISADNHTTAPNMDFNFLPEFVHYQGTVTVIGQKLENIDTGISDLKVEFISQAQSINMDGKSTTLEEGHFKFSTVFGADIPGKYHIDVGPGVPGKVIFDIYVGGIKATESLAFLPTAADGCMLSNCMNVTFNLVVNTIPRPTPTPVPPTPTPLPVVNPSLYSGQIVIGSDIVPDGVKVYAQIQDYISDAVETKDGKYSISINPITINYVDQPIKLVIQGNDSITTVPFKPNQFISDANFLFPAFEIKETVSPTPVPPTPEPLPTPKPETIIVVATPTPSEVEPLSANKVEDAPVAPVAEGGGCSGGGGASSISLFSIFVLGLLISLSSRFRKPILARIRL